VGVIAVRGTGVSVGVIAVRGTGVSVGVIAVRGTGVSVGVGVGVGVGIGVCVGVGRTSTKGSLFDSSLPSWLTSTYTRATTPARITAARATSTGPEFPILVRMF